jgi:two-component system, NarL family, invasion response regulator UvrY
MPTVTPDRAPEPNVQVLVVDDQPPFRAAARAVLHRIAEFDLVGEASSGEEAVALSAQLRPDLVLMDINMGEMNGIEAARQVTVARPETMVILVSTYAAQDLPADARTSGAVAYVHKDELSPRLLRSLWESHGDPAWPRPA